MLNRSSSYFVLKRSMDILGAIFALLVFSPIMAIIAIAIKIESPGPVFFRQKRTGKNKGTFSIIKFRSMRVDSPKEIPTHLLEKPDKYITRVGRLIRKTSLDELPQFYNVLKGEMSLVGPRPALWNQIDLINERDKYGANSIRPGITGWAQINGRDELPIKRKAALDGEYVARMSLLFDLECMIKTIVKVPKHEGVIEGKAR